MESALSGKFFGNVPHAESQQERGPQFGHALPLVAKFWVFFFFSPPPPPPNGGDS